ITITDRRMRRYFMTIPEAVQLIIRAGSLASDRAAGEAEVFVLDMGEPVAIVDLARQMIELEEIGPRPGEKLDEQLFNVYERPQPTAAEKILLAEREPLSRAEVDSM